MSALFDLAVSLARDEAARLTKEREDYDEPYRYIPAPRPDADHELFLFDREEARAINGGF